MSDVMWDVAGRDEWASAGVIVVGDADSEVVVVRR
jgi:hypothetical protein